MTARSVLSALHTKKWDHAMVDIESLSLSHDAIIIQIALVPFILETGRVGKAFSINVDPDDCKRYGLKSSAATLEFWNSQSPELQLALQEDQRPLDYALEAFSRFYIHNVSPDARLWSHSTFDIPTLKTAFERVGMEAPWYYRNTCDIRTLQWLAGNPEFPEIVNNRPHDAVSDCVTQVEYVHKCYTRIKEGNGSFKI